VSVEVFVASRMTPEFCADLGAKFTAHFSNGAWPSLDEATRARVNALVTNGIRGAEKALLDLFPNLQIIASLGIGVDAIDFDTARARGLVVTNTPNVIADDVADLAMGMLIDRLRHIVDGERFVRAGKWSGGPYPLARSLTGKRLGTGRVQSRSSLTNTYRISSSSRASRMCSSSPAAVARPRAISSTRASSPRSVRRAFS
jgi:lactate dehydrogenase-like 2-hydroxyacid dehydrogenase